jgi:hypothetical protein
MFGNWLQDETRRLLRALELDHATLKVTCQTRKDEIEKLQVNVFLAGSKKIRTLSFLE